MSEENKTLNKGLDALLGQSNTNQRSVKEIEISKIKPGRFQPRSNFDNEKLQELTESIKKQGVLSPILVRELGLNEYEVIAGERRLRSSKMAGLETIPCLVDQKKDQDALVSALIENLQREDLNPVEEARGLDRLKREFGLTQDEVAASTGKARSTIANSLRILSLPTTVLDAEKMARKIIKERLTVKDLSNVSLKNKSKNSPKSKQKDTDMLNIEQEMSESFGHKVEIETKNKKSGKVSIFYKSLDELDNIIAKIKK